MGSGTAEIITGRERRRCWSLADKLRILAECDAPGVQVAEVAARNGIYRSLVFQWRRQARDGLLVAEPTPEFVPVRVTVAGRQDEVLPDPEPAPPPSSRKAAAIEIELPDGIRVRMGEEVGLVALRRVLAALRG
ncbi:IS66-like element accessory protein TnpA [Belnapia sp. F-4-1]|uniref:IS66-like element accessory protein TnpA n=1 Tax=Belnapia sp. F-4-1 TaxID=1545443 RepID=UPI0005B86290|nr:transposase [Belnapia sp. F-4-1]